MQGENSLFMSSHAVSAQTLCTWGTTSVKADILSPPYSLHGALMRSCLTPYGLIAVNIYQIMFELQILLISFFSFFF